MRKLLLSLGAAIALGAAADTIDLAGCWEFGYGPVKSFDDTITLPGSMLTNGKGEEVTAETRWTGSLYDYSYYFRDDMAPYREKGNIKFPFFLTPDKVYVGHAWYRRKVNVPADWEGRRMVLHLERPHIETTVTVNGMAAGHRMSLSTPHEYDITPLLRPGRENVIEIDVYNGIENVGVGADSHSVTDQTQGNWNGITGSICLRSTPADRYISNVRVYPDVSRRQAVVKATTGGDLQSWRDAGAVASLGKERFAATAPSLSGDTLIFIIPLGEGMRLWDEFDTPVYDLEVTLGGDTVSTVFGMREIAVDGRDLTINGRKLYIRGTVECACFPLTGYAPTEVEPWERIFAKCREYGINMMRFHSYCPPEAAFTAADRAGIYLQPEGPSWPNHGVRLNEGMPIDSYLMEESKRIIDTYGNHPSFVMMAAGNEPSGDWVTYCNGWVKEMKHHDPTKLYCGASVGGGWNWDDGSEFHVKGGARGLDWSRSIPSSDDDYADQMEQPRHFRPTESQPVNTDPILSHEQGQWCVFPDFRETDLYTGPYKARNFEIFHDLMERNGMKEMAGKFLMASGRLQTLCYKYEIERNLRTPGYSGFQLLGLNDYSGQGTALEGVLNVFWQEKGYVDGRQWREFCSEVVPLARFPKFVFTDADTLRVPVEVMNASARTLTQTVIGYVITDESGKTVMAGKLGQRDIPLGKNHHAGTVELPLGFITEPRRLTLTVKAGDSGHNSWQFWVYPREEALDVPAGILLTDTLDSKAIQTLRHGGKVLLAAAGKVTLGSDIVQHYLPVFWNTSWFKMRPPHTTGVTIDTTHPLFRHDRFPTDDWGNLNWWELVNRAQVMNLLELPLGYQSPVQPIDTWHLSRKLGMIVEAQVEGGKLLMTTLDITNDLDNRVVARRMRNAMLDYMSGPDFSPSLQLDATTVSRFFTHRTPPVEMFTDESPDELKPKIN